jgi:cAMP-binding proteins - catabolite gene activator and regulatory subunit of cAMP-dependent protein kinases
VQLDPSAFLADPELIKALQKRATRVPCDEDRVLFRQGDSPMAVYILSGGSAKISMNCENDGTAFCCQAGPGSLLGLPGLIANQPYSLTVVADKGATVSMVTRDEFNALVQTEPGLMVKILQVLAAEVRSARMAIIHT